MGSSSGTRVPSCPARTASGSGRDATAVNSPNAERGTTSRARGRATEVGYLVVGQGLVDPPAYGTVDGQPGEVGARHPGGIAGLLPVSAGGAAGGAGAEHHGELLAYLTAG